MNTEIQKEINKETALTYNGNSGLKRGMLEDFMSRETVNSIANEEERQRTQEEMQVIIKELTVLRVHQLYTQGEIPFDLHFEVSKRVFAGQPCEKLLTILKESEINSKPTGVLDILKEFCSQK